MHGIQPLFKNKEIEREREIDRGRTFKLAVKNRFFWF